jgi:3-oxoacyl-[acyl-carrier-protein] synthase II
LRVSETGVFVHSLGAVSAAGTGVAALASALGDPDWQPALGLERPDAPPLPVATCRDFSTAGALPPLVARRLDRPARLLAVAAREALHPLGEVFPWERERVGACAGTWNAGTSALLEVLRAVFLASPEEAPPAQFPSTVANAPASQLGILEKLGGPNVTFAEKQVGGLRAIAEGARMLLHGRADAVLACGVDEANWINAEGYERLRTLRRRGRYGMVLAEGAAVLLLARDRRPGCAAALAGWGAASSPAPPHRYPDDPAALVTACHQALARAGLRPDQVDAVVSAANGIPAAAELDRRALVSVLGAHRPAAVGVAERLGEGAAGGALRALIAALTVAGGCVPAWGVPTALAHEGFPPLTSHPRRVLVPGVAGGGSAVALVVTAV